MMGSYKNALRKVVLQSVKAKAKMYIVVIVVHCYLVEALSVSA